MGNLVVTPELREEVRFVDKWHSQAGVIVHKTAEVSFAIWHELDWVLIVV